MACAFRVGRTIRDDKEMTYWILRLHWGVWKETGEWWLCLFAVHGKINPKDWQVLSLGDGLGFSYFFRVVSGDYGKPCKFPCQFLRGCCPDFLENAFRFGVITWLILRQQQHQQQHKQKPKTQNSQQEQEHEHSPHHWSVTTTTTWTHVHRPPTRATSNRKEASQERIMQLRCSVGWLKVETFLPFLRLAWWCMNQLIATCFVQKDVGI